jgi:hypothetical protein
MLIQLHKILDVAQYYEIFRTTRWQDEVPCPACEKQDPVQKECEHPLMQLYRCRTP